MAMDPLLEEIDGRLRALVARLDGGDDAPPAQRLRLEGLLEAAVISGIAQREALQARVADAFTAVTGRSLDDTLGEDWRDLHPFPQLPLYMRRAPVVPGGGD